jgi:hypothetical protein
MRKFYEIKNKGSNKNISLNRNYMRIIAVLLKERISSLTANNVQEETECISLCRFCVRISDKFLTILNGAFCSISKKCETVLK